MDKIITREKVEERIPFCFGLLQRIADDLQVTRTAVWRFVNLTENTDLKELIKEEKKRLQEYADMTIARHLLSGDLETAKWFVSLNTIAANGKKLKPYKPKKNKYYEYLLLPVDSSLKDRRHLAFSQLDSVDALRGGETRHLPYGVKEQLGLLNDGRTLEQIQADLQKEKEAEEKIERETDRRAALRAKNSGKSGREIYEEFKKNWEEKR